MSIWIGIYPTLLKCGPPVAYDWPEGAASPLRRSSRHRKVEKVAKDIVNTSALLDTPVR